MYRYLAPIVLLLFVACASKGTQPTKGTGTTAATAKPAKVKNLVPVKLTADLSTLSEGERKMIPLLVEAAQQMDQIFWQEAYGDPKELLAKIKDPAIADYARVNYGPWDRLGGDKPFVDGFGDKPAGANFYPTDITKAEFEDYIKQHPDQAQALKSLYTVVTRKDGQLVAIPYNQHFATPTKRASELLAQAAELAEDPGLKKYLQLRSKALLDDNYKESDLAWLDMKDNGLDVVIGPIETYEDKLFGYKAAHEAYILIKDKQWSQRLAKYAAMLPGLQKGLPVPDAYKAEKPGTDSDLNAYDVVYYAGDCNAGSKTIAINLPNDSDVQLAKGTRRLQLKNAMRAKYDKILVPIANKLIAEDQRSHITFNAFFSNTMFHEVAHGLGIKQTLKDKKKVRTVLREQASALEEGKADILGLYMVTQLFADGTLTEGQVEDHYVTFMAGIFRSSRFGASSAHGRANMMRFNFFQSMGAFSRDETTGLYRVDFAKMKEAMTALSTKILTLQGDGDYAGTKKILDEMGVIGPQLQKDLDSLDSAGIPVDVVFEQGLDVLGLKQS